MRRRVAVLAVVVFVALAGCGGLGGEGETGGDSDETAAGSDDSSTATTDSTSSSDSTGASSGGTASATTGMSIVLADENGSQPEVALLTFDRSERYVYRVTDSLGTEGELTVDVTPLGNGSVTLDLRYSVGGNTVTPQFTFPADDGATVRDRTFEIQNIALNKVVSPADVVMADASGDEPWEVGASFEGFGRTTNVTGTDTIAGIECFTYEVRHDAYGLRHEGCVSPHLNIPVSSTGYRLDGEASGTTTLVSYERP